MNRFARRLGVLTAVMLACVLVPLPAYADITGTAGVFLPHPGACGGLPALIDDVAAVSPDVYDAHGCGSEIDVAGPNGTARVRVVDRCPGCQSGDIDLSPAAFEKIADPQEGRVSISWKFI